MVTASAPDDNHIQSGPEVFEPQCTLGRIRIGLHYHPLTVSRSITTHQIMQPLTAIVKFYSPEISKPPRFTRFSEEAYDRTASVGRGGWFAIFKDISSLVEVFMSNLSGFCDAFIWLPKILPYLWKLRL